MSHLAKLSQIARRDFTKDRDIDESDDEEEGESGKYNIDPSSNMWKPIDFGRSNKKGAQVMKSSESDTKLRPLVNKSDKTRSRDDSKMSTPRANTPPRISPRSRLQVDALPALHSPSTPSIIATADKKKSFARLTAPYRDTIDSNPNVDTPLNRHESAGSVRDQLERQKLAKEREELKQMLEAIHREKRGLMKLSDETQRKASAMMIEPPAAIPPDPIPPSGSTREELSQERDELRGLMEELQREKKMLMALHAKRTKEKNQETVLAAKEREELRIQLEIMRTENEHLVSQMRSSAAAAQVEIEKERQARQAELQALEAKNKMVTEEVLQKQAEAEKKLAQERDELKVALKRMEKDKLDLCRRVYDTEAKVKAEALELEAQRKAFQEQLSKMEAEKVAVCKQMAENETAAKCATEEMARQLAAEKLELQTRLTCMENDKSSLAQSLQDTEVAAKRQAEELARRLLEEKDALQLSTQRMEHEKMELAKTLAEAEQQAKEQARIVSERLEKEKHALQETKLQMQREREELEAKLAENEKRGAESNAAMSEELREERERLCQHLELMQREKEEMEARLKEAADQALEREKAANDRLAKERDELRQAVERMKEEMELEKKRFQEERSSMQAGVSIAKSRSRTNLKPTSSLYDMMEAQSGELSPPRETRNNRSHAILPIKESEEEVKGVASFDAGDSEVAGSGKGGDDCATDDLEMPPSGEGSLATGVEGGQVEQEVLDVEPPRDAAKCEENSPAAAVHTPNDVQEQQEEEEEEDDFVDLPAPHAAAARGDLDKLHILARMDPTLLASFDEAGRCPLFYSVAYEQASVTSYLLDIAPECIHQTDAHGDTPLHAGASSGSIVCLKMIIDALKECRGSVNPRNSMGMTPVHLAMNASVLSLLYEAGADLTAVDKSDRSGLFVAAAMNRKDCVEFLLDCLDGDDDALYMQDSRGDTPLHAAACNGAEDCLLLLLQCGISPLTTNKRNLKAIDLAQKNKKKKCREILAQYHLHFATNSDFDSVLFIAALEVTPF